MASIMINEPAVAGNLRLDLEKVLKRQAYLSNTSDVSIYYYDFKSLKEASLNGGSKFQPASLLKVSLMMGIFKAAKEMPNILHEEIRLQPQSCRTPFLPPEFPPSKTLTLGSKYSIDELIRRSISYSDNLSTCLFVNPLTLSWTDHVYADLGLPFFQSQGLTEISAADYARLLRAIYEKDYLGEQLSEKALKYLFESDFSFGLKAGLPPKTRLAHKFGERTLPNEKQLHDCGIIQGPRSSYLLCVMTKGSDLHRQANAIADISRAVYRTTQR